MKEHIKLEPYQNGVILHFNGMQLHIRIRGAAIGVEPIGEVGTDADTFGDVGIDLTVSDGVVLFKPGGKKIDS